jgi:NADP-dependent 3-hydroxy acid dehydrogenase YdfG
MNASLPGRIAAVTGAESGIGKATTLAFAARGEKLKEALVKAISFLRLARAEEVAAPVLFFASDAMAG